MRSDAVVPERRRAALRGKLACCLPLLAVCLLTGVFAAGAGGGTAAASCDTSWVNTAGGLWSVPSNWTHGVPDATKKACILRQGTYAVSVGGSQSAAELTLGGSSGQQTLGIVGGAAGSASLTLTSQGANPDGVRARGVIHLASGNASANASLIVSGAGVLQNSGLIAAQSGASSERVLSGTVLNLPSGKIQVNAGLSGDHDWTNRGSIAVAAGQTLDLHGGSITSTTGSAVSGAGTIVAPLESAGLVTPGGVRGVLTLTTAAYTQDASGKLNVRIFGSGSTLLAVSGGATLNGTAVVQVDPSVTPTLGQTVPVVSAGSYTGGFAHIANALINQSGLYWRPDYPSGQPTLSVTQATLTVPADGTHGKRVTVSGTGWLTSKLVQLRLADSAGTTTAFKSALTDGTGSFSATVFIPAGAAAGPATFTAKDTTTGLTLTGAITIS